MDCKRAKTLFVSYHDGDLPKEDLLALQKHLDECKQCFSEWEDYLKTMQEVSQMHKLEPSQDFVSRVKKTIGHRSRGRFFGQQESFSLRFAIISFVLIIFFLLAYLFISVGAEIHLINPEDSALNAGDKASKEGATQQDSP